MVRPIRQTQGKRSSPQVNLAEKLTKYVSNHVIFYVTLDPERALGLEDILPNYTIICPYRSDLTENLKKSGVDVFVLEENMSAKKVEKIIERGTYGILKNKFVRDLIKNKRRASKGTVLPLLRSASQAKGCPRLFNTLRPRILVLKNSALIEGLCKKQGWKLLAPRAKIAEQFENKISQYKLLKNIVPYPPSSIRSLKNCFLGTSAGEPRRRAFGSLRGRRACRSACPAPSVRIGAGSRGQNESPRWGDECVPESNSSDSPTFVLQFNRGHSGNSTFFIKRKEDIKKLYKLYPKREVKISEYIKGKTYTLNCLVFKNGALVTGSISEQITGLKSATSNPNTTVGNDFSSPRKLGKGVVREIRGIAEKTGRTLHSRGYRGLFGIDVIISEARNKRGTLRGTSAESANQIYFIEINTHQPASISFEARLHRKIGKVPLLAYFILDSFETSPSPCEEEDGRGAQTSPDPSFVRRGSPPIILPIYAKQIIYRNKTGKTLPYAEIEKKHRGKSLISRSKIIRPNEEIYRRQVTR